MQTQSTAGDLYTLTLVPKPVMTPCVLSMNVAIPLVAELGENARLHHAQ